MLMGRVDTFMLSAYSDISVAAVGMSNQVINSINCSSSKFGDGGGRLHYYGA